MLNFMALFLMNYLVLGSSSLGGISIVRTFLQGSRSPKSPTSTPMEDRSSRATHRLRSRGDHRRGSMGRHQAHALGIRGQSDWRLPEGGRYAGMNVTRKTISVMVLSGDSPVWRAASRYPVFLRALEPGGAVDRFGIHGHRRSGPGASQHGRGDSGRLRRRGDHELLSGSSDARHPELRGGGVPRHTPARCRGCTVLRALPGSGSRRIRIHRRPRG